MRSMVFALCFVCPFMALKAQESRPAAPITAFHLDWQPKIPPLKPKGQRIHIDSIKIEGQMEERGHWRKYYFNALKELPTLGPDLKKAFAMMLTAKGFTVVEDPSAPTYDAVIYIDEADTSGNLFSGMGEARPLEAGRPWLFRPKSFEILGTCEARWRKNESTATDASMEMTGQGIRDRVKVKRTHKIEPKIKFGFTGISGKDLMSDPAFVENATRCIEGLVREVLDLYMTKMDEESVNDIVRKLQTK